MADLVVTVPKWFWNEWIAEGDAAGDPPTGGEWDFSFRGGARPDAGPGDRCYIVAHGMLRGYAPIVRVVAIRPKGWSIVRAGGAVAMTIAGGVSGFRGEITALTQQQNADAGKGGRKGLKAPKRVVQEETAPDDGGPTAF